MRGRQLSFIAMAAVAISGCATSLRVGVSPTVDTAGKWGAVATLGVALGESYREGRAAVMAAAELSGGGDERGRGQVALGLGAEALGESEHFGFRIGVTLAGRLPLPTDGRVGGAVGGRIALLPVVKYVHRGKKPERCGEAESWTYWHLGVELSGQYLWGSDSRGLFAAGPVFEIDALSTRVCD